MNIKIKETSLNQSVLLPLSLDGWKAFTISREQALKFSFREEQANFAELSKIYGVENILEEGTFYSGYAVICSYPANILIKMYGKAQKTAPENLCFAPQSLNAAYLNGCLYKITFDIGSVEQPGSFSYNWPLGTTPFERIMKQSEAVALREKLVEASLNSDEAELTAEEVNVVKTIFGSYYKYFFKEV